MGSAFNEGEHGKKNVIIQELIYQGVFKVGEKQLYQLSLRELETAYHEVLREHEDEDK
ncbi:Fur-regulated basic protein FbpA [Alteribacter natronophilus]|uniref:Fur-regulated basic protein FbpA n=1 Tax=Alteribacter natronophilus TaxID=2583810 RepID=UPI00110DF832|nr:Fur-regulated basic protein FbpA [Alteribacter natronophilus]TMW70955.1 Fur-regulated basic protein FbpA [Alteribacter natronophilus]